MILFWVGQIMLKTSLWSAHLIFCDFLPLIKMRLHNFHGIIVPQVWDSAPVTRIKIPKFFTFQTPSSFPGLTTDLHTDIWSFLFLPRTQICTEKPSKQPLQRSSFIAAQLLHPAFVTVVNQCKIFQDFFSLMWQN